MPPGHHRDFKGVWIPKEIWLAEDLSLEEKALFVEIHSLDNERGCWASNNHFARFLGSSDRSIQRYLRKLEARGYIRTKSSKQRTETGKYFDYRVIRIVGKYARRSDEDLLMIKQRKMEIEERMKQITRL